MSRASTPPCSTSDTARASAPRSPPRSASTSCWGSRRRTMAAASYLDGDDLGDALDPVLQDALDAGLHGERGCRAGAARADELDLDPAGLLVDRTEDHVPAIGLQGRADHLHRLQDLITHTSSVCNTRPAAPIPVQW